jgi:hypothetical protein
LPSLALVPPLTVTVPPLPDEKDVAKAGIIASSSAGTRRTTGMVAMASMRRPDGRLTGGCWTRSRGSATRIDRTIDDLLAMGQGVVRGGRAARSSAS